MGVLESSSMLNKTVGTGLVITSLWYGLVA